MIILLKKLLQIFRTEKEDKETLLYEMFYRRVFNTANHLLRDSQLAQDITQETFISAFEHLDRMDNKEKLGAWLVTICTRKAIDFLRKQKRWNDLATDDVIFDKEMEKAGIPSPVEEQLERQWVKERLEEQVNQLHPAYKQVIILKYIYELKEREIAETLNISLGTVKSRLYRARRELKKNLLQEEEQPLKEGNT